MSSSLYAISPIDGRYSSKTSVLREYFSENALIFYRIKIEIYYFKKLLQTIFPQKEFDFNILEKIEIGFCLDDALKVKEIEKTINHDVKAIEYFIKEKLKDTAFEEYLEFIHFGLTSQDINNTAIPLSLKDYHSQQYIQQFDKLLSTIKSISEQTHAISMLARTHGQPASPTLLGKELYVFVERLQQQFNTIQNIPFAAKFGGATGNFNAHYVAFPDIDWYKFAQDFVNNILGLSRSYPTTQIEHYDFLASLFHTYSRINTILIDFCRDIWTYISMDYFKQIINEKEVGSSAMPHKVNPIDFENAEGNLGIANAIFMHLAEKLPISRLQRDLTDSTVLRNIGVPLAHTSIAFESIIKGLSKLQVNTETISNDLENNWIVIAEGIQTILRRENYPQPYEALKKLTRSNQKIDKQVMHDFIKKLEISDKLKDELMLITPENYVGKFNK
jgi:adenylosuccinate lyase